MADKAANNAAAISAEMHTHADWSEAYEASKDAISGFPGMWVIAARAGLITELLESDGELDFDRLEWIEFVTELSDKILTYMKDTKGDVTDVKMEELILWVRDKYTL